MGIVGAVPMSSLSPPPGVDSGAARVHREYERARVHHAKGNVSPSSDAKSNCVVSSKEPAFEQDYDSADDNSINEWSGGDSADSNESMEADEDMQRAEDELEQQL